MKLTGFLFYFCHIQISTELKDEAMGFKFLRIKKERERRERRNKTLLKCQHMSDTLFGPISHSP